MDENQVLAAVQEILFKARIKFTTGTAAEWTAANPVLLDGEYGLIRGTSPMQFKVGDGTKTWSALGWGNVTSLAQLSADANHRLVTDAEKNGWNDKAPKSHAAADTTYGVGTSSNYGHVKLLDAASESLGVATGIAATPKALNLVLNVAQAAQTTANEAKTALDGKVDKVPGKSLSTNDYSTAEKTKLAGIAAGANNYTHPATHSATMITQDATHRFTTDSEKAVWNGKADTFVFDHAKYAGADATASNAQKQIVKDIVAAANAGKAPVIFIQNMKVSKPNHTMMMNGVATVTEITAQQVTGVVSDFAIYSISNPAPVTVVRANMLFNSDGTVSVESESGAQFLTPGTVINDLIHSGGATYPLSAAQGYVLKQAIDNKQVPAYSMSKVATEAGFASTYRLTKDGNYIGQSINIPLDQVLRGSSIKTVTVANSPYTGAKAGDKYIEFLFQNNSTPQYLPVQDLVDVYTGDDVYVEVSPTNVITLKYEALRTKLFNDANSVFDKNGAGAAAVQAALDEFKASTLIIQCTIPGMS